MSVLLAIVKFIGIALLILLALLLLLLLVILFVPIRYQAEVSCYNQQLTVRAKVSYLLQMFRITAGYSMGQPVHYSCKLLWFTLFADEDSVKKVARKTKKAAKKAAKVVEQVNKDVDEEAEEKTEQKEHAVQNTVVAERNIDNTSNNIRQSESETKHTGHHVETPDLDEDEENWYEDSYEEDIYESSKPVKKSSKHSGSDNASHSRQGKKQKKKFSIRGFWESLKTKLKAFVARLKAFYQRFLEVKEKGRLLKKLYDSEVTKRAFSKVKKQACYLFRHLKPRVIKGSVRYGFHDPAMTGEVLAGISMFYPVVAPHFEIVPDFMEACFEGEVTIRGHIRLIHVAVVAITLFFNRALRKTIKRFQRITGGNE